MNKYLSFFGVPMCALVLMVPTVAAASVTVPNPVSIDSSLKDVNVVDLTPQRLVQEVSRRNASAVYDQLQWEISQRQVDIEKAIFEPEFIASLTHRDMNVPNTVEEALAQNFQSEYQEKSNAYYAGVRGFVPTGGQWSVLVKGDETNSNIIERFKDYDSEYENTLSLMFRQPLLKGFGKNASIAKIRVAEYGQEVAYQSYRQRMMEVAGAAIQAYWNLYRSQSLLVSAQESLSIAEQVLRDVKARVSSGKSAQTDVLEAETGVALRKANLLAAEADLVDIRNRILTLLNVTAETDHEVAMRATLKPEDQPIVVPVFAESLGRALDNWPAYLIAQKKQSAEEVQVKFAKNQRLPQLDVEVGYDAIGLDSDRQEAFEQSYNNGGESWYMGLELSVPLGNQRAKNELSQARIRKRQADLEVSSVRRSLSNSLHSRLERVRRAEDQLALHRREVELGRRMLEIELMRVEAGKSDVRELLRQEEDLNEYQRKYLESVVEVKLAEAALDIAEGTLLTKYDVQVQRDQ